MPRPRSQPCGSEGIAITPRNYWVWYTHCEGTDPSLSNSIEAIERKGGAFDSNVNAMLCDKFFGLDKQEHGLQELSEEMAKLMTGFGGDLKSSVADADKYGRALDRFSNALTGGGDVSGLVGVMQEATGRMRERISSLEQRVESATSEVEALQEQLHETRKQAHSDHLTGLANRKRFDQELERLTGESARDGTALSLMLLDLDHFKTFNDTHGHPTGDMVLKLLARALRSAVSDSEVVARYGGEEFAIILPNSAVACAKAVGERIRERLAGSTLTLKSKSKDLGQITVSIGVAEYQPGEPLEFLVERADAALYRPSAAAQKSCRHRRAVRRGQAARRGRLRPG